MVFNKVYGVTPDFEGVSYLGMNGDDTVLLYSAGIVVDRYGNPREDGTHTPWDHHWRTHGVMPYRKSGTGPSKIFNISDWIKYTESSTGCQSDGCGREENEKGVRVWTCGDSFSTTARGYRVVCKPGTGLNNSILRSYKP